MGFKAAPTPAPVYNAPNLGGKYDLLLANLPSDAFGFLGPFTTAPYGFHLSQVGNKALFLPGANIETTIRLLGILELTQQTLPAAPANIGGSMPTRVVNGQYIYVPQGFSASGTRGAGFYRYNLFTNTWATMAAISTLNTLYRFQYNNGCLWDGGGFIYVIGGYDGSTDQALFRYNISMDTWAELADVPGGAPGTDVGGACEGPIDGFIYACRGLGTPTLRRYSVAGDVWGNMANAPFNIRQGGLHQDPANPDLLYVFSDAGAPARYSISGNSWTLLTGTNPPGVFNSKGIFFTQPIPHILINRRTLAQLWVYKV